MVVKASLVVFKVSPARSLLLPSLFTTVEEVLYSPRVDVHFNVPNRPIPLRQFRLSGSTIRIDFASAADLSTGLHLLRSRGFKALPLQELRDLSVPVRQGSGGALSAASVATTDLLPEWAVLTLQSSITRTESYEELLRMLYPALSPQLQPRVIILPTNPEALINGTLGMNELDCLVYRRPLTTGDDSLEDIKDLELFNTEGGSEWTVKSRIDSPSCLEILASKWEGRERMAEILAAAVAQRETILFNATRPTSVFPVASLVKVYKTLKTQLQEDRERHRVPLVPEISGERPTRALNLVDYVEWNESQRMAKRSTLPALRTNMSKTDELWEGIARFHTAPERRSTALPSFIGPLTPRQLHDIPETTTAPADKVVAGETTDATVTTAAAEFPEQQLHFLQSKVWKEVVARLEALVDGTPSEEIPLLDLGRAYLVAYGVPLNPFIFGYSDVKALVLAVPSLSLVWVYEVPYVRDLRVLETRTRQAEGLSGPVSPMALRVRKRTLSIDTVSRDVTIALVAHWVLIHEAKPMMMAQGSQNQNSGSSHIDGPVTVSKTALDVLFGGAGGGGGKVSSIGMSLPLLARTWDSNWSYISTLASTLERINCRSLEEFVTSIPAFEVRRVIGCTIPQLLANEPTPVIYLKQFARIPVVPEMIPDPSAASFDVPATGETHLVFFPPTPTLKRKSEPSVPRAVPRKSVVRDSLVDMMFELVTACCEWQRVRWQAGEDLLELQQEMLLAEDQKMKTQLEPQPEGVQPQPEGAAPEEGRRRSSVKSDRRGSRRYVKLLLRDYRFQRKSSDAAAEETEEIIPKEGGGQPETFGLLNSVLSDLNNAKELDKMRTEYKNRNVGVHVSALKLEWTVYFDGVLPLTYLMEECGLKKLKLLLAQVPNLVFVGEGGFVRTCTVEHAKLMCNPYPPSGLNASGSELSPSAFTEESNDPRYQIETYTKAFAPGEVELMKSKPQFLHEMSHRNAKVHAARLAAVGAPVKDFSKAKRRSSACVWELATSQTASILGTMLGDLVIMRSNTQRHDKDEKAGELESYTKSTRAILSGALGRENGFPEVKWETPPLQPEQAALIQELQKIGIQGLAVHDVPRLWNYSFALFSPFTLFLNRAGFSGLEDKAFEKFVTEDLKSRVLVATTGDSGAAVLFPASLDLLNEPTLQRPANLTTGAWIKRKTKTYLDQAIQAATQGRASEPRRRRSSNLRSSLGARVGAAQRGSEDLRECQGRAVFCS